MSIISIEIMKIIDEQEKKKKTKQNKKEQVEQKYSKRVRAKWFCCGFMLRFFQLTCKASLIFKLNLLLALSVILKERELNESKHVVVECRCLKIWDLLYFLICSSILVSKWWQVLPI